MRQEARVEHSAITRSLAAAADKVLLTSSDTGSFDHQCKELTNRVLVLSQQRQHDNEEKEVGVVQTYPAAKYGIRLSLPVSVRFSKNYKSTKLLENRCRAATNRFVQATVPIYVHRYGRTGITRAS